MYWYILEIKIKKSKVLREKVAADDDVNRMYDPVPQCNGLVFVDGVSTLCVTLHAATMFLGTVDKLEVFFLIRSSAQNSLVLACRWIFFSLASVPITTFQLRSRL